MNALLLSWDIETESEREYINFVLGEYIPTLQRLGLKVNDALLKLAGTGPQILAFAQASDLGALDDVIQNSEFLAIERRLLKYVGNFERHRVLLPRNFPQTGH